MPDVLLADDVRSSLERIKERYLTMLDSSSFANEHKIQTSIQAIVGLKFEQWIDAAVHAHIMEHAIKAEQMAPGAFSSLLRALIAHKIGNPVQHFSDTRVHPAPNTDNVHSFIKKTIPGRHDYLSEMVVDAVELAGMGGKIIVEKTTTLEHIEHVVGYNFLLKTALPNDDQRHVRPFVACLDAIVDTFSQVEKLLEDVYESEQTCVLFARGFSDEVLATIQKNNIQIVPVLVPVEYETVNTIVDVAVICGCDVLSITKGETLESLRLDKMVQVERIDVSQRGLSVFNTATRLQVSNHKQDVFQRSQQEPELVSQYMEGRLRSLTPNTVYIRLSDDAVFVEKAQNIDKCLRGIRSMIDHGVMNDQPAITEDVANIFFAKCVESLAQIGAAVKSGMI